MTLKNEDLAKAIKIKVFLEKNYQNRYAIEDLARMFGINRQKLKYAFKAISNKTIHGYVIKVRIENAKNLLQNTDHTLERIASKVGLDKSNLNIHFKRLEGTTPHQWRKNPSSGLNLSSTLLNETNFYTLAQ